VRGGSWNNNDNNCRAANRNNNNPTNCNNNYGFRVVVSSAVLRPSPSGRSRFSVPSVNDPSGVPTLRRENETGYRDSIESLPSLSRTL